MLVWVERLQHEVGPAPPREAGHSCQSMFSTLVAGFDLESCSPESSPGPSSVTYDRLPPVWSNFKGNELFVRPPSLVCVNKQMGN